MQKRMALLFFIAFGVLAVSSFVSPIFVTAASIEEIEAEAARIEQTTAYIRAAVHRLTSKYHQETRPALDAAMDRIRADAAAEAAQFAKENPSPIVGFFEDTVAQVKKQVDAWTYSQPDISSTASRSDISTALVGTQEVISYIKDYVSDFSNTLSTGIASNDVSQSTIGAYETLSTAFETALGSTLNSVTTAVQNISTITTTDALYEIVTASKLIGVGLGVAVDPMFSNPGSAQTALKINTTDPQKKEDIENRRVALDSLVEKTYHLSSLPGATTQTIAANASTPAGSVSTPVTQITDQTPTSRTNSNNPRRIVPCDGLNCNLCSVGQLAQNIINFLLAITIPIAALMFAYAGALYVINNGNPNLVARAKKIFKNVAIGFAIALSGWLVVQTILSTVFDDKFFIGGNWNQLKCVADSERLMDKDLSDLFDEVFGEVEVKPIFVEPGTVTTGCTAPGSSCTQLHGARFSYKAGRIVTDEYASKLEQFGEALASNIAITITEACPAPPGVHQNECHYSCTCTDIATTNRSLMQNANYLNAIHNAAKAVGMCAVFETRGDRPAGYKGNYFQGNYENHFSLYMDSNQSVTCHTAE